MTNLPTLCVFGETSTTVWHTRKLEKPACAPARAPAFISTRFTLDAVLKFVLHSCLELGLFFCLFFYVTVERWLSLVVTLAFEFNKLYEPDMIVPRQRRGKGKALLLQVQTGGHCQRSLQVACWGNSRNPKLVKNHATITRLDKSIYFIECGAVSFTCTN